MNAPLPSKLIDTYRRLPGVPDEMLDDAGDLRSHWRYVAQALDSLGHGELAQRKGEGQRLLRESGVTYSVHGDASRLEHPWELDPIPHLVASDEWAAIESGLMQRAELMNLLLSDIYGPQNLIKKGILPLELIYGHGGFLRPLHGLPLPGGHNLPFYAADLARGADGRTWVLDDRSQAPSGAGYALENRVVMTRILPSLFRDAHVHRLALFFQNMRASIAGMTPRAGEEARVVVLTPGPLNETFFEHSLLASYLGYTLAQGDDLTVSDGRLWLRSMKRLEPVDVILRRVDDHYCDPLELRTDSRLGVPGLTEVVRRGNVRIINPLGSSALENVGLYAFLPEIAHHLLGQELELPSPNSWWCGRPSDCSHVLANLEKLLIKPTYREAGSRMIDGSTIDALQLDQLRERIKARPHLFVGQERIRFSTVPALVDGGLEARHAVLRAFLVARKDGYVVMPGGLTRIAPSQSSFDVSGQAGGLSKDTWILATEPEKQVSLLPAAVSGLAAVRQRGDLPGGAADSLFWLGRYAERAEQSARCMRTILRLYRDAVEYQGEVDKICLDDLLQGLTHLTTTYPGFVGPQGASTRAEPIPEIIALVLNRERRGTIGFNLQALLAAAHAVRDRFSGDTWRIINGVRIHLDRLQDIEGGRLNDLQNHLDEVITALIALAGGAQESMERAQAWLFLDMGRRIERGLLLISLLRSTVIARRSPEAESLLLESVLRNADSLQAYRRVHHDQPQIDAVLDLLLHDDGNPRSLAFQLHRLQERVEALPRDEGVRVTEEQRLVLDAVHRLQLSRMKELVAFDAERPSRLLLDRLLNDIAVLLRATSRAVATGYFADLRGPRQLVPEEESAA
jgi:uncharacterized circularly permuted ATP-grasp superfamily protein/uncharacterized alpha-E superfamily protein